MAISFVGSHVGTHAAITAQTVAFSNLKDAANTTPTLATGDIVVVTVINASTVNRSTLLVPTGYTAVLPGAYVNRTYDTNFQVATKVMGATPDTTVDIPASNATTAGVAYSIYVLRGVDTATPLDTSATNTAFNLGSDPDPAAITPVTAGAWIMVTAGSAMSATSTYPTPTDLSTTTNHWRTTSLTTGTQRPLVGTGLKTDWTSGAFDPEYWATTGTISPHSCASNTIAFRPVAGGGGPPRRKIRTSYSD